MATGIAFLMVCLAIGYVGYWMITNEKVDPNGGYDGWFAMTRPKPKPPDQRFGPPPAPRRRDPV
jgi:hypothetical protein